jgi:hypothetical protein
VLDLVHPLRTGWDALRPREKERATTSAENTYRRAARVLIFG